MAPHFLTLDSGSDQASALESLTLRSPGTAAVAAPLDRTHGTGASSPGPFVGASDALLDLLDQIGRVARTASSTVLVLGESGTGKELVSRAIHDRSRRAAGPFVAVNCAALTDSLMEAELFGYEPGAFTGAARNGRDGLLAAADGGTLFLDEVGELAPALQAKLLRVLQERTYRRVGGHEDLPVDARIIASTHRDLVAMVEAGGFREDLFYRLNVLCIHVPALRERVDDLPLLADHFLAQFADEHGRERLTISDDALELLSRRTWPGNVRELRNTLERASLMAPRSRVCAEHVAPDPRSAARPQPGSTGTLPLGDCSLKSVEEALIRHVMGECGGNRSHAARVLGVNRSTLYSKLRAYRID